MSDSESGSRRFRVLEVVAVIFLGITTVGSAFCGYQATRWNSEEADLVRDSTTARVEAARLFSLATQTVVYDTSVVTQYAAAAAADDQRLVDFYRTSLVRAEFLPIIDEWTAAIRAGQTPQNLLENDEYLEAQLGGYRAAEAEAERLTLEAQEAGNNADEFVLTALLLAVSLFFAGVTSSFRVPAARLMLLVGAVITLALSAARLVDLPIL